MEFKTSAKNLQTGKKQNVKKLEMLGVKFLKQDYHLPALTSAECTRSQVKKFDFRKKHRNLLAIRASFRCNVSNITFSTENLILIIPSFQLLD